MSLDTAENKEINKENSFCISNLLLNTNHPEIQKSSQKKLYTLVEDIKKDWCISLTDFQKYEKQLKKSRGIKNKKIASITTHRETKKVSSNKEREKKSNIQRVYDILESENMDIFLATLIEHYIGRSFFIGKNIIVLSEKNMDTYIYNLKRYLFNTILTESSGNENSVNSVTSARWCGQWLINDGRNGIEVADLDINWNRKWFRLSTISEEKNKERMVRIEGKFIKNQRERYFIGSYENALNRSLKKYNSIKEKLPESIKNQLESILPNKIITSRSKSSPIWKTLEAQMLLLTLDTITHTEKKRNNAGQIVWIDHFIASILHNWSQEDMIQVYKKFHHTQSGSKIENEKAQKLFYNNFRFTQKIYKKI